jgi:hypothetical protein
MRYEPLTRGVWCIKNFHTKTWKQRFEKWRENYSKVNFHPTIRIQIPYDNEKIQE